MNHLPFGELDEVDKPVDIPVENFGDKCVDISPGVRQTIALPWVDKLSY